MPPFPLLRSIGFTLAFTVVHPAWLLDVMASTLESSEFIEEIIIAYLPLRWQNLEDLRSNTMAVLDNALSSHPTVTRIRWRFDFSRLDVEEPCTVDGRRQLSKVASYLRQEMPMMYEKGGLVVEVYSHAAERTEWRTNFPTRSVFT
jgi:hypothetical protein